MLHLGIVPSQLHCIPNQFDDDAVLDLTCNEDGAKEITTFRVFTYRYLRFAYDSSYYATILKS